MTMFSKETIYETMSSFDKRSSQDYKSDEKQSRAHSKKRPFLDRVKSVLNKIAEIAEPIKKIASAFVSIGAAVCSFFTILRYKTQAANSGVNAI